MLYATLVTSFFALVSTCLGAYTLAKEYSGQNFFDGWDFYGAPDLFTNGTPSKDSSLISII